ncbi:MAG: hypothetical protein KC635_29150, partial [Myxococcales bacterium]|nr:hypothetical protein [Myxococcales bacterium]
ATVITVTEGAVAVADETFERSDAAFDAALREALDRAVADAGSKDVVIDAPVDLDARTVLATLAATPSEVDSVWARVDGSGAAPGGALTGVKLHDRAEGAARAMRDGKTIEVTLDATGVRAVGRAGWDWREGSPTLLIPRVDGKLGVEGLDAFVGERLGEDDRVEVLVDSSEPTRWGDLVATLSALRGAAGWFTAGTVTSEPITARELEKQAEAARERAGESARAGDAPAGEADDAPTDAEGAAGDDSAPVAATPMVVTSTGGSCTTSEVSAALTDAMVAKMRGCVAGSTTRAVPYLDVTLTVQADGAMSYETEAEGHVAICLRAVSTGAFAAREGGCRATLRIRGLDR